MHHRGLGLGFRVVEKMTAFDLQPTGMRGVSNSLLLDLESKEARWNIRVILGVILGQWKIKWKVLFRV